MHRTSFALAAVLVGLAFGVACSDHSSVTAPLPAPSSPRYHVGYKGPDVPFGYVTNDAECHIGKKGTRWPIAEQYEVKTFDARLTVTPNGGMTLVCTADIPDDQPRPTQAEVEQAVLCFLPGQRETRDAREVFTPGGKIILTCHLGPNET